MKAKKALKRLNKVESLLSNPSDETGIRTSGSVDPRLNVSVKAPRAVSLKRRTERSFAAPRLKPARFAPRSALAGTSDAGTIAAHQRSYHTELRTRPIGRAAPTLSPPHSSGLSVRRYLATLSRVGRPCEWTLACGIRQREITASVLYRGKEAQDFVELGYLKELLRQRLRPGHS